VSWRTRWRSCSGGQGRGVLAPPVQQLLEQLGPDVRPKVRMVFVVDPPEKYANLREQVWAGQQAQGQQKRRSAVMHHDAWSPQLNPEPQTLFQCESSLVMDLLVLGGGGLSGCALLPACQEVVREGCWWCCGLAGHHSCSLGVVLLLGCEQVMGLSEKAVVYRRGSGRGSADKRMTQAPCPKIWRRWRPCWWGPGRNRRANRQQGQGQQQDRQTGVLHH